ncbi:MAG TPA: hypothetical protein VN783_08005 [Thermoanaerobaculia bacterium]|nr:hypothetical protein [Thermoanaerobaculia bacterium]
MARLGRSSLSRAASRDIVRHLLSGCESCQRIAAGIVPFGRSAFSRQESFDYTEAFASAYRVLAEKEAALHAERVEASHLVRELGLHPFDRQQLLVANSRRFWTWAFCDLLLDRSHDFGFQDPSRALELAQLGVKTADLLSAEFYGEGRVYDLRARAWAIAGNAQRIGADFRAAEGSFTRAERLLKKGTSDPLEKARVLLLKASLLGDLGRFAEAAKVLSRVLSIAQRNSDAQLLGKALVKRGIYLGNEGRTEAAIDSLAEGIRHVDPKSDPRLLVAARHNLIIYLTEAGRLREAVTLLDATRPLYRELGDRMNLIRLRWLEGKIAQTEGRLSQAETLYREVGESLAECGLGYDSALLGLDLAGVYARQGRMAEMRTLAAELLPTFQSREVHREALAALIVFQKAAEMERVTLGLVQELSDYLRQCRRTPGVRFRDTF